MRSLKHLALFFALCFLFVRGIAQKSIEDSTISFGMINLTYSASWPGGDLSDRFGMAHVVGPEIGYKFSNNFYTYTGIRFLFGSYVRERIAANVTVLIDEGSGVFTVKAIGNDGRLFAVRFFERGIAIPLIAGKIFHLPGLGNPNSGIYLEAGPQFFQHRVRIEIPGEKVPALSPEMKKGYDRLTNGIGIAEGIGYKHFSNNKLVNFYAGIDLSQNWTKSRRSFNYDTGVADTHQRMDLTFGIKAGWVFLIYQSASDDFYIY